MKICATPYFFAQKMKFIWGLGVEVPSSGKKALCSKL